MYFTAIAFLNCINSAFLLIFNFKSSKQVYSNSPATSKAKCLGSSSLSFSFLAAV
jgi:hypothetical protein